LPKQFAIDAYIISFSLQISSIPVIKSVPGINLPATVLPTSPVAYCTLVSSIVLYILSKFVLIIKMSLFGSSLNFFQKFNKLTAIILIILLIGMFNYYLLKIIPNDIIPS